MRVLHAILPVRRTIRFIGVFMLTRNATVDSREVHFKVRLWDTRCNVSPSAVHSPLLEELPDNRNAAHS